MCHIFFFRCHNTTHYRQDPDGTELRYNHAYIIGYVQCFYMITTMILPLVILIVLSLRIYQGLIKVRKNLNRHKRLVDKAETANLERHETINAGVEECNIKVNNVIEEEEDGAAEGTVCSVEILIDDIQCALNVFCPLFIFHYIYRQKSFQKARKGVEFFFNSTSHSSERRAL